MKHIRTKIILLLWMTTCITLNSFSQDYMQWGLPDGAKLRIGKGAITGNIAFSPDSSRFAVTTPIGIWIYDTLTGQELKYISQRLDYTSKITYSPDGNTIACNDYTDVFLFDVETGTLKLTIHAHNRSISSIDFSFDGKTLATSSDGYLESTIKIWDPSNGNLIDTIPANDTGVDAMSFSPTGKVLVSSGSGGEGSGMNLWDVSTGDLINTFIYPENFLSFGGNITISPDGNIVAICAGRYAAHIYLWDIVNESLKNVLIGHIGGVLDLSFSPDSETLASCSMDNTVVLWDVSTGNYITTLIAQTDDIVSVSYSPDGTTLASYSKDGTIILWDANTLKQRAIITGHIFGFSDLAFSPNGDTFVTGSIDKMIRLWDTNSGSIIKTFIGHIGPVLSVAFSPDGQTIASSGDIITEDRWFAYDFPIRLWDVKTGAQKSTLYQQDGNYKIVSFSPDGRILVDSASDRNPIFWDASTGNTLPIYWGNEEEIGHIVFSPDGKKFVYRDDNGLNMWDIEKRELISTYTGSISETSNIVFSPDGSMLATGGSGQETFLWDVHTGERNTIITGHVGTFKYVDFSPDGKTLLTASYFNDDSLLFWDPVSTKLKLKLTSKPDSIYRLAFSPDGSTLATMDEWGTILLWDYESLIQPQFHEADVNTDGVVDIQDLIIVAANLGKTGPNLADVNGDGVVNIADLIIVAGAIENIAAPSIAKNVLSAFTVDDIQKWLSDAKQLRYLDSTSQRGIHFLQQLLVALEPKKTALLPNYPNPFNPETWIPYQLAEAGEVTIQIYSINGELIRILDIGHRTVGLYQRRNRAAYWNGKNDNGEPVASGVYFYTLSVGEFSTTRKMHIVK